jgi:hypothetical protein
MSDSLQTRPTPLYAAVFDGKMLKRVSDCPVHPKYQGKRPPTSADPECKCHAIWQQARERADW